MNAIVKTVEKESEKTLESVVISDIINIVYTNKVIILVKSNGRYITYSNLHEDYYNIISVI